MPVKPTPIRIECRQCGWSTVYAPRSDALVELPPESCGRCGSADLARSAANLLDSAVSAAFSLFKK